MMKDAKAGVGEGTRMCTTKLAGERRQIVVHNSFLGARLGFTATAVLAVLTPDNH